MNNTVACPPNKRNDNTDYLISHVQKTSQKHISIHIPRLNFSPHPQRAPQAYETYRDLKALKPPKRYIYICIYTYIPLCIILQVVSCYVQMAGKPGC